MFSKNYQKNKSFDFSEDQFFLCKTLALAAHAGARLTTCFFFDEPETVDFVG